MMLFLSKIPFKNEAQNNGIFCKMNNELQKWTYLSTEDKLRNFGNQFYQFNHVPVREYYNAITIAE